MTRQPTRIAMWSGPRNISTAMMRAFGNRPEAWVSDEPLYACYLASTGKQHPGARAVIDNYETDWRRVVAALTGPLPPGKTLWYQKHMSHHLLAEVERGWILQLANAFLIRAPAQMLASLSRVLDEVHLEDTGLAQQVDLFRWLREQTGDTPPVIDARDVLEQPAAILRQLCDRLGVEFQTGMLSWPAGPRNSDGNWARHWYGSVQNSAGFTPYQAREVVLPERLAPLLNECDALYQELAAHRLRA